MKIFIDVNVFIDVMTRWSGWSESLRVLNLARRSQEIESWTSALTVPLLYFFRRRVVDETIARADAQAILKGLHLVPMNQIILDHALAAAGPDFEDNIQLASAESISANHLITRNIKDFDAAQIAVLKTSGRSARAKTTRIVVVVFFTAAATSVPHATMRAGFRATSSAAKGTYLSSFPSA